MQSMSAPWDQASAAPTLPRTVVVAFTGNVTTQPFTRLAGKLADMCAPRLSHHDFGQPIQALLSPHPADFLIVHLDHRWFFEITPDPQSFARMDELIAAVKARVAKGDCTVVLNTIPAIVDAPARSEQAALRGSVARLNGELYDLAASTSGVVLLDLMSLVADGGRAGFFRERNRYFMQFPYSSTGLASIVEEYAAILREHYRPRRKVIVVDADNTLWGGVIGEVGPKGIGVSDEYPHVLHKIFQLQLKHLKDSGFLIAAVTKNNDSDFREAFSAVPMPLAFDDFVSYRANWNEKSENLLSLVDELNVGLDSVIFIDDSPFEVEEVVARAPGVEGHVFQNDNFEAATSLLPSLGSLRSPSLTDEDRAKTGQYRAEAERARAQSAAGSLEDYLASLEIELAVGHNLVVHIPRIAQLTNKTNQFNLTTRRYTEAEIREFMGRGDVFDFRLVDKFGDMGIIGVVIVVDGVLDTFLLSCRVLGRKVESEILRLVTKKCGGIGLTAEYIPTAKNGQTKGFYPANGFQPIENMDGIARYRQISTPEPSPHIKVIDD